ncbi:MAG: dihydroorotate dehydrogenase-like protein [Bacteroidales bacterium]|nr:dihydroorotate dehydrogenase-like protein [Bacteroidales bacterium]MDD4216418.1 dihydroorotate dehydrogenase-like protein [Bacteroidales bacterium]MDY0142588.1 dihydroorotate dehydrogenase-like protein [Bacteroidales bacterium]
MEKLKTNYLGLKLKCPVIVSSSGLTKKIENLIEAEESGAGAIVLKSIFEEQITYESNKAIDQSHNYPEVADYIRNYSKHNSLNEYIQLIKDAKKAVTIPIIASINCTSDLEWGDYAKKIEAAGADALELNMNIFPFNPDKKAADIEEQYYKIVESVKKNTKLPIACKLGKNFTNLPYFIKQLNFRGVNSFVLFNKFFEPLIDINKEEITNSAVLSHENDLKISLRWVAIIKGMMPEIEISASTGIHSANACIQQILAGADTVQLCSVLYRKGISEIKPIISDMIDWMDKKSYKYIDDFRGKLSYENIKDPQMYERFQFIKYFANIE